MQFQIMEETGDINQTLGGEAADQNGSSLWTICTLRFKLSLDHQQQQRSVSWEHFEHLLLKCRGARPLFNFHWAAAFFKGFTDQRRLQKKRKKFNPRFYRSLQVLPFNEPWVASTMSNLSNWSCIWLVNGAVVRKSSSIFSLPALSRESFPN